MLSETGSRVRQLRPPAANETRERAGCLGLSTRTPAIGFDLRWAATELEIPRGILMPEAAPAMLRRCVRGYLTSRARLLPWN